MLIPFSDRQLDESLKGCRNLLILMALAFLLTGIGVGYLVGKFANFSTQVHQSQP